MIDTFYVPEIILGLIIFVLSIRIFLTIWKIKETHYKNHINRLKAEYEAALEAYIANPQSQKKEEVFIKGDEYLKFKIPDYYENLLPNLDSNFEFIDNQAIRKKIIEDDIKSGLDKKQEIKAA
jgi:hypothetical protein